MQPRITDPLNRITQTVYDDLDLPVEVTDALNQKTTMENNGNGDTKKLTDARQNIYTAAWDGSGIRKSLTWPDASKQTQLFNANGDLTQWKARGQIAVVNFTLNTSREVVGWDWSNGAESGTASLTLNSFGQLTAASTTTMGLTVSQNFSYDGEGRLAATGQVVGNVARNASVSYNANGQIASLTYPAGFVVAYEYNSDSQLTCIKKNGSDIATYAYDTGGRLATRTLSSGVVTTYTYDAGNRLLSIVVTSGGYVLWAERYGYNAAGERIYTLQGASGTAGDGYWLDATSQLRGVKYGSTDATVSFASQNGASTTAEWEYDEVGNRLHENGSAGTTTYVTDVTNQYVSVSSVPTVAYSARGDMTQFGNWAYTYDAQGNMIRAHNSQSNTLAKYWRDASGHRAVKDVDGNKTIFLNIGTTQMEAYDVTNAAVCSTIYEPGIDLPLAEIGTSGSVAFFYHQNWLGNVVLLTNAAGGTVESYSYRVWGQPTVKNAAGQTVTSTPQSRFLFTAREYDAETSLFHYRAREYSPALGRILQIDPIDFGGGDVNIFRYVGNNSINLTDPFGLEPPGFVPPANRPGPGSPNGPVSPLPRPSMPVPDVPNSPAASLAALPSAIQDMLRLLSMAGILRTPSNLPPPECPLSPENQWDLTINRALNPGGTFMYPVN